MAMKDELPRRAQAIDRYMHIYMTIMYWVNMGITFLIFVYTLLDIGPIMMCKDYNLFASTHALMCWILRLGPATRTAG